VNSLRAEPSMAERSGAAAAIILSGLLGLALYAVPDRFAATLGLEGHDGFAYRAGGAAFVGYAVALLSGWTGDARSLRLIMPATLGATVATAVAGGIALAGGHGGTAMAAIVFGSVAVAVLVGYPVLRRGVPGPLGPTAPERDIAPWLVAFFVWGTVASALFGLGGLLLGGTFGLLTGAAGMDDPVYRLAGAATIGILVGSLLTLRSRNWHEIRLVSRLGFVTNLLTLIGVPLVVATGTGAPSLVWLIGAAAAFNTGGLGLALLREGR
jgi:hypothetical protein